MTNAGRFIGVALGVLTSATAIFVIVYGAIGATGNSFFTGALFSLSIAAVFIFSFRQIVIMPADYLFGSFLLVIAASMALNGQTSNPRECALLLLVLASYWRFASFRFQRSRKSEMCSSRLLAP